MISQCTHAASAVPRLWTLVLLLLFILAHGSTASAQLDRQSYLEKKPLAKVDVQSLAKSQEYDYSVPNQLVMYQPEAEDPLSLYARTQDGEWQIPTEVDPTSPWVRLLVLTPMRPTIVDVAVDINQRPYRAAREAWIDKLLAEAKATFLVRTGVAAAEAEGISDELSDETSEENSAQAISADNSDSVDGSGEQAAEAEPEQEPAASEEEPSIPMVSAQSRKTRTLFKRLINYLAADQSTADREEVRWLLAEWTGGPSLLTLGPASSWRRANTAPLWHVLDQDDDQALSRQEVEQYTIALKQADINRDDIVDLSELDRVVKQKKISDRTNAHPLTIVLDNDIDWRALRKNLKNAYGQNGQAEDDLPLQDRLGQGDRSVRVADLGDLMFLPPDLVYHVSFESEDAEVSLIAAGDDSEASHAKWRLHSSTDNVITVEQPGAYMEVSAAQGEIDAENASGDMKQTQIAVGAVVDGYPLFRLVDVDNNRQLTLRERRNLESLLTRLDHNEDGRIDAVELPAAIRLTVTHGPQVHRQLAQPIAAQRGSGELKKAETPAWFVGMDRNRDGDLSKREFQGSPTQFAKFDRDSDGLISRAEVQELDAKK